MEMKYRYLPLCLIFFSLPVLLSHCGAYDPRFNSQGGGTQYLADYYGVRKGPAASSNTSRSYNPKGYWDGDGITGTARIRIIRAEQKAYFYKGDTLVGISPISSGNDNHTTPAGSFKVTEKDIDHESSLYGVIKNRTTGEIVNKDADFRIHKPGPDEIAIHAPMPYFLRFNHGIGMHTGFLPGYAASHGCIRLPDQMAKHFYENAKIGTPVIVE